MIRELTSSDAGDADLGRLGSRLRRRRLGVARRADGRDGDPDGYAAALHRGRAARRRAGRDGHRHRRPGSSRLGDPAPRLRERAAAPDGARAWAGGGGADGSERRLDDPQRLDPVGDARRQGPGRGRRRPRPPDREAGWDGLDRPAGLPDRPGGRGRQSQAPRRAPPGDRGTIVTTSNILRDVSVRVGGFIAAARNPVEAAWVKKHAAIGAITYALDLGAAMQAAAPRGAEAVIEAACAQTGGTILARGPARITTPRVTSGGSTTAPSRSRISSSAT